MTSNQELRQLSAVGAVLAMARKARRYENSWRGKLRSKWSTWRSRNIRPLEIKLRRSLIELAWWGVPDQATAFAMKTIPDRIALGWFLDATEWADESTKEDWGIDDEVTVCRLAIWIYQTQPKLTPRRIDDARHARRLRMEGMTQQAKAMFSALEILEQEESAQ